MEQMNTIYLVSVVNQETGELYFEYDCTDQVVIIAENELEAMMNAKSESCCMHVPLGYELKCKSIGITELEKEMVLESYNAG